MFIDYYGELCALIGKSESAVAIESGVGKSTVSRWRKGSKPQDGSLHKLHEYFSQYISISYEDLKNGIIEKEPAEASSFIEQMKAIESRLSPEQQKLILDLANNCIRN